MKPAKPASTRSPIVNYRTSAKGIALLKAFEGCELTAYDDGVGVMTIGYGTTKGIKSGMCISQDMAEHLLKEDLSIFEADIKQLVKVPLYQHEFDALVVFTYNIGASGFEGSSVLRLLNSGDYIGPLSKFLLWNKAGGEVMPGLIRRRMAEAHLFAKNEVKTEF